ncbi:MAG: transporter substrate-binding domain-containing protein [Acetobacteraceae bacterium]|nr:transporter substrate-binding domain-containing protein [Acetobacteraceae bacterium]
MKAFALGPLASAFALLAAAAALLLTSPSAPARSLSIIREGGSIGLCVHPNALPFSSKTAEPPGFQVELGRALAKELGVSLDLDWVTISYEVPRTSCDLLLDMVADRDVDLDYGIKLAKPYYRSGVGFVVPAASKIVSFNDLDQHTKVGVLVGSVAAMVLDKHHVPISIFGSEDDMLAALADGEIDAAAVAPIAAQYFGGHHRQTPVRYIWPDEAQPDLVWNVAVGIRRPDDALRAEVDRAMERLMANGTIARIYAGYGVSLRPPK